MNAKSQSERKNVLNKRLMGLIILVSIFLNSCSLSTNTPTSAPTAGIRITSMNTAIGGSEEDPNEQIFSYNITLFNTEPVDVVVHWIEPVLTGEISKRVLTADRRIVVEKTFAPNSHLEISGRLTFDASGVSKSQITSWEPLLTAITVSSEVTLSLP